ncbi:hypothetical protein KKH39_02375 [Patescibacteria group bacterium]|nr:hypothetical protein [Patescibacteria group bacterium]
MLDKVSFKNKFELPFSSFHEPIDYVDGTFGFSTMKEHSGDYASLFKITIPKKELDSINPLKQIYVSVSYGKKTEEGIILASSGERIKGLFDRIDLRSDDFFCNFETGEFFEKNKKIYKLIDAHDILVKLESLHEKPLKKLRGFPLRIKLFWFRIVLAGFFKFLFYTLSWIESLRSGQKFEIFQNPIDPKTRAGVFDPSIGKSKKEEPIDIFGYKVKPQVAFIYSFIHLLVYSIFFVNNYKSEWMINIFSNIFLTVMYVIISLGLMNIMLPQLLKPFMMLIPSGLKKMQSLYISFLSKKINI